MSGLPIEILAGHPHAGERGVMVGDAGAKRLGLKRFADGTGRLVALENCPHGNDACYVFPGDFRTVCERRPR
jgi:hypothetical protein